jgi:hypothetical protein
VGLHQCGHELPHRVSKRLREKEKEGGLVSGE